MRWPSIAPLVLLALALGGCGEDLPPLRHHGLVLGALDASPRGEPLTIGRLREPTTLVAEIDVGWRVVRDGRPEETGKAHLQIVETLVRTASGLSSDVRIAVSRPEGIAAEFVEGLDGVALSIEHDAEGRLRPATLRFSAKAPENAQRWIHDLWLGGFGPGRSWLPGHAVREGEVWSRRSLGGVETIPVQGIEVPDVRATGGVRLDSILEDANGERLARLTLESLLEAEGHIRQGIDAAAVSVGHLAWGVAIVRLSDGVPRSWTYRDRTRYLADDGVTRQDVDLVTEVVGEVRSRDD